MTDDFKQALIYIAATAVLAALTWATLLLPYPNLGTVIFGWLAIHMAYTGLFNKQGARR